MFTLRVLNEPFVQLIWQCMEGVANIWGRLPNPTLFIQAVLNRSVI